MLLIYEKVLGLKFVKINSFLSWIEDNTLIELYEVKDSETNEKIGFFYLDLFPRPRKYSHAACFPIQPGCVVDDMRQLPVAAMVANFTKPRVNTPSLLTHSEVITYFHELGHVMHHICSKTKYARFHGTSVEGDFVEAPSQMLENWCWDFKTLKKLSCNYQSFEPLSEKLINQLIESKNLGVGIFYTRQLFLGFLDMHVHSITNNEKINTTELYMKLRKEISFVPNQNGTFPVSTFGHLMGGYDAGYYGYLWSQVYSSDMFYSKFKNQDNINSKVGKEYRNSILKPGSSMDGIDMFKKFVGREPKADSFIRELIGSEMGYSKL